MSAALALPLWLAGCAQAILTFASQHGPDAHLWQTREPN
jgi:hypothetical protein